MMNDKLMKHPLSKKGIFFSNVMIIKCLYLLTYICINEFLNNFPTKIMCHSIWYKINRNLKRHYLILSPFQNFIYLDFIFLDFIF